MGKLTAKAITEIEAPGRYSDGNGLYLLVAPAGTKSWVQRVRLNGKPTDKGIGSCKTVTLAKARKTAEANRTAVKRGGNPFAKDAERLAAAMGEDVSVAVELAIPTFANAVLAVYDANCEKWDAAVAKRFLARLVKHCAPLEDRPVDAITRRDLAAILTPLRREHHETARKVRQGLAQVFKWVRANDYRADDPADDALEVLVESVQHTVKHRESLHHTEVASALHKIRFGYALRVTQLAFEFLIFTVARTSEVRHTTWDEIDLANAVWEIPAERMKARRSHRVPLSTQAVSILRALKHQPAPDAADADHYQLVEATGYVFRMPSGKTLSENAFLNRARKDELGCVPHGFRASFMGWAQLCSGARFEAIELSLAHTVGTSVQRAYERLDYLEERRELLQAWGDYLDPPIF